MSKSVFIKIQCPGLVRNLTPNGSCILKIEFWIGQPIFNNLFLETITYLAFLKLASSLLHSTIAYGKQEENFIRSVLQ